MFEFMVWNYFDEGIGKIMDENNVGDVVYLLNKSVLYYFSDGDVFGKNFLVCFFCIFLCVFLFIDVGERCLCCG